MPKSGTLAGTMNPYQSPTPPEPKPQSPWIRYSLIELVLVMTMVAILAALYAYQPVYGVFASVVMVPASLRTLLVLARRRRRGIATTRGEKFALLAVSACVIILFLTCLVAVLAVALFVTLVSLCFSGKLDNGDAVFTNVALGTGALVLVVFLPIVWHRWKRDTTSVDPAVQADPPMNEELRD